MAFVAKKDYCGFGTTNNVVISGDAMGASGNDVTAADEHGSIVASTYVYGGANPSNDYELAGSANLEIKLGKVNTVGVGKYMLTGVSIGTRNSGEPTLSATAAEVESAATTACTYDVDVAIPKAHHAALLFNECTISGNGCYLTDSSYSIQANASIARSETGTALSSDVHGGMITASLTINQTGNNAPTVAPAQGWSVSSPLTQTNPKSNYPTWTITLTKYLTKTVEQA